LATGLLCFAGDVAGAWPVRSGYAVEFAIASGYQ
jgi:hypothetical protein